MYPPTQQRLEALFTAHRLWEATDREAFLGALRDRVRGIAVYALHGCPAALIEALPRLEIIASFGIGVDTDRYRRCPGARHPGNEYPGCRDR